MSKPRKTVITTWDVRTYDVWGNREEGYEVNDSSVIHRDYPIMCKVEIFNRGLVGEFKGAFPSDYAIQQVFGVRCKVTTDGDDISIYVNRESDGCPIGDLQCTSHASLSPIRAKEIC